MQQLLIVRSKSLIEKVLDQANEGIINGSKYRGMSYESGLRDMYDWLTGESDDIPLEIKEE